MAASQRYLALCPHPIEEVCAKELRALAGVRDVHILGEAGRGAIAFSGGPEALYRANLYLRSANRVLVPLYQGPCRNAADLYNAAREIPWEIYLAPRGTLAVSAHGLLPGLGNSMFSALKVKDAVVDRFRDRLGQRPSVHTEDPDLRINVQLYSDDRGPKVALALDSSGAALHRRGYRQGQGEAPLKETLAAAILLLAGYRGGPLYDPLCGGGTLLTEGGLLALGRAPGLMRSFGFARWQTFDKGLWARLREEASAPPPSGLPAEPFLFGADQDPTALRLAMRNGKTCGLTPYLQLQEAELSEAQPKEGIKPGILVCNPPYGQRMGEEQSLVPLYRQIGDVLKRRFTGWTAYVYTANLRLAKEVGLRPSQRQVLYNGDLEGRLLRFDLY